MRYQEEAGVLIGAPVFSWLVPLPCFPQSVFRSLQLLAGPLHDLVFGMTSKPGVHCAPYYPDLVRRLSGIGAKHDSAPIAYQVHVGKHTRFEETRPSLGFDLRFAPVL
jgi:hypothetical protein